MNESFDISDMSWLTQCDKVDVPNFKIMDRSDSKEDGLLISGNDLSGNVVCASCVDELPTKHFA